MQTSLICRNPIFREAYSVQHPYLFNIYWYVLQLTLYLINYCKIHQVLSSSLVCQCMFFFGKTERNLSFNKYFMFHRSKPLHMISCLDLLNKELSYYREKKNIKTKWRLSDSIYFTVFILT